MFTSCSRFIIAVGFLALLFRPAPAQDKAAPGVKEAYQKVLQRAEDEYRLMFRKPESVPEYWTAIRFEIDVGKFDVAALLLKQMLEKEPAADTDKQLVKIEEAQGLATFLRLRRIRQWSDHPLLEKEAEKNVDTLIDRVTTALEQHLADPVRLRKFIKSLDAPLVEERAYAFTQLNRSRDRAAPYLLEALRASAGTPLRQRIRDALVRLDEDVMPPLIAALTAYDTKDAKDIDLRVTLLDIVKARGEKRAVPDLWQLAGASKYPAIVRQRAQETQGFLLEIDPAKLPPARIGLWQEAERHARHQVRYSASRLSKEERKRFEEQHKDQQAVVVWKWGEKGLSHEVLPASQADAYYGLLYAREALEIEPGYRPAQTLFLVLTLEQAYGPHLDQVLLEKTPPALRRLLAEIDGDLLDTVLERALTEGDIPVIVGAAEAIGQRGEARLMRPVANAAPRGLVRALSYPDRRVQLAAARALLRLPSQPTPAAAARVVEVLRRFLAAEPVPRILLLYIPLDRTAELRAAVKGAGYDPVFAANVKEAFEVLHRAADIDAILINYTGPAPELPYLLTQLRTDQDIGLLPVLLIAPPERARPDAKGLEVLTRQQFRENLESLARRHRNVWVIAETAAVTPDLLKSRLERYLRYAALPAALTRYTGVSTRRLEVYAAEVKGPLSPIERKQYAREALEDLGRMGRGERPGYDLRPAEAAVTQALRVDDMAGLAAEVLAHIPGADPQQRLAAVVLDSKRGKLRITAAAELNRHIQKYGLVLPYTMQAEQLKQLRGIAGNPAEDPALRTQVAFLVGYLGGTPRQTGIRLYRYTADEPMPPRKQ